MKFDIISQAPLFNGAMAVHALLLA